LTVRRSDGSWTPFADVTTEAGSELKLVDPLNLKLQATGVLSTLLPTGFATPTRLSERLTISPFEPGRESTIDLAKLFDTADESSLVIDLDDPVAKGLLYDVIVSLTYSIPVQTVTPAL
jgi:hypothetical protein